MRIQKVSKASSFLFLIVFYFYFFLGKIIWKTFLKFADKAETILKREKEIKVDTWEGKNKISKVIYKCTVARAVDIFLRLHLDPAKYIWL